MRHAFEILGIHASSTEEEAKVAYRELARKLHPDRDGGDADAFGRVSRAWADVGKPADRAAYLKNASLLHKKCPGCRGDGTVWKQKGPLIRLATGPCKTCGGLGLVDKT